MPTDTAAPARLFPTSCMIEPDGAVPGQGREVRTLLDLADVLRIREGWDFDTGAPLSHDGRPVLLVDLAPDICAYVLCEYETFAAAWLAWRTHADKLARLRN